MIKLLSVFLVFLGVFLLSSCTPAYAYIDPGSGGYLISATLAMIGGILAFLFAFVAYFFRNILLGWIKFLWKKHRILSLLFILLVIGGIGACGFYLFYEPSIPPFDPELSGAHIHDAERMYDGYNLFAGSLIDMRGNPVKKWSSLYLGVIDKNGDYYAQKYFEAPVWGRYTWDDEVIWEMDMPIHHEIILTPSDTVITFAKEVHEYKGRKVEFDVIVEFDKNGNEIQRFSFWENLKRFQGFHRKLELDQPPTFIIPEKHRKEKSIWGGNYDYYHLNSLSLIPENDLQDLHPAFRPGNWLIAFRHGSIMFILDRDTKKVLWRAIDNQVKDRLEGPHAPQMLPSGNILVFDNGRYRKWSRVLEINPLTLGVEWEYREKGFYTLSQGYVQKLPNGNMLAVEAEKGRVLELTPEKEIVWEYYHPDRQDETNSNDPEKWGSRQEIYRMTRYPKDMIERFLKK